MASNRQDWEIVFASAHIVPPCKGLQEEALEAEVKGSEIDACALPTDFFYPLFSKDSCDYPLEVVFNHQDGVQRNDVRDLICSLASGNPDIGTHASRSLACRLASSMDRRSRTGLFVALVGKAGAASRVLLWVFPNHRSLTATVENRTIALEQIVNSFAEESRYFKAAMFEGGASRSDFWLGRVEDRQASRSSVEASQFWTHAFLNTRAATSGRLVTQVLVKAIKGMAKKRSSSEEVSTLYDAASVVSHQHETPLTLRRFAGTYLSPELREAFLAHISPTLVDAPFQVDAETLLQDLRLRTLSLGNGFQVRGPAANWEDVVGVTESDSEGVVTVTVRGRLAAHSFVSR